MNQFLIKEDQFTTEEDFLLTDPFEVEYLKSHLKKQIHDQIKICFLNHGVGTAQILKINAHEVHCKVSQISAHHQAIWDLLIAWPRPQQAKRIIEFGTSMGVRKFDFFTSELSDPNYTRSSLFLNNQYESFLEKGLIQSKSYYQLPKLRTFPYSPLNSYGHYQQKYFLDLEGGPWPKINFSSPLLLAIGPERGWSNKERNQLISQNYIPIKIHQSTLKEELAIYTSLGQLTFLQDNVN